MFFSKLISLALLSYVGIYNAFDCIKNETSNIIDGVFDKSPKVNITNNSTNIDNRIDKNLLPSKEYDCMPFQYNYEERMNDFKLSKIHKTNLIFSEKKILRHKNFRLIPAKCGWEKKRRRVKRLADGKLVKGNFPWMSKIFNYFVNKDGKNISYFGCTGTVINERYILTAGHCLYDGILQDGIKSSPYSVYIGTENSQLFEIDKLIRHEEYTGPLPNNPNRKRRHDIGLIRLKEKIPESDFYPICLPFSPSNNKFPKKLKHFNFTLGDSKYSKTRFVGAGFGNLKTIVPELKQEDFKIINLQKCRSELKCYSEKKIKKKIDKTRIIEDEQFCAGSFKNGGSILQTGDSGGPLMYEEFNYPTYQVGIMSFGANMTKYPPNTLKPDVFQNVRLYLEWILDNISP